MNVCNCFFGGEGGFDYLNSWMGGWWVGGGAVILEVMGPGI